MKRVAESSGAKYSIHNEKPRPAELVAPVVSFVSGSLVIQHSLFQHKHLLGIRL